ncbi:MAG: hypothetical protein D6797_00285 [Bdellovibrio sp.]|nr:MAG: hypothetical protein D6797_00285 [Bdellovibrio sp.]
MGGLKNQFFEKKIQGCLGGKQRKKMKEIVKDTVSFKKKQYFQCSTKFYLATFLGTAVARMRVLRKE